MKPPFLFFISFLLLSFSLTAKDPITDSITSPIKWLQEQNTIGQELLKTNQDFDKAVNIFESAFNFASDQNILNQFPEISIGYGIAMYKNGDAHNSYSILKDVLPKIDDTNLKMKADVNQIIGMTLVFKNKFSEGYKHQMDALKYYSDIGDSTGMMSVYYDLGSNFGTQGQSELALENFEKGIVIAKAQKNTKMIILGTTAIGNAWASTNEYEKALVYIRESMELAEGINDDEEIAWASINRGHILAKLDKYEESKKYLKKSYDLSFKIGNKLLTAYSMEQMSDVNLMQGQLSDALKYLDKSLKSYQELGQTNGEKNVTMKYAEIYFQQKNFTKYKEYTDRYIALKDSLYSKEMMETMASLKQDFEIHKIEREKEIALLTKDQELVSAKNYASISITCGALVTFVLLLILLLSRNRSAIEKNNLLAAKNAEILRQNEFLANSNRDLEKFAYIISHDLKEPLRNINGFTKLLVKKLSVYTDDETLHEYASFITNGTQQMGELLNGLLEYSKISVNKSEKELVDFNQLVNQVVNNLKIQQYEKNCKIRVDELPQLSCRPTHLKQVFQNLIANAIKFTNKEKDGNQIAIGMEELEEEYIFSVQDNGIGIAPEYQKDIFVVFKRLHDRGTYSGSGIGLATCKKIVEDHGGRIWVSSKEGEGSCFRFTIPKDSTSERVMPSEKIIKKDMPKLETA